MCMAAAPKMVPSNTGMKIVMSKDRRIIFAIDFAGISLNKTAAQHRVLTRHCAAPNAILAYGC